MGGVGEEVGEGGEGRWGRGGGCVAGGCGRGGGGWGGRRRGGGVGGALGGGGGAVLLSLPLLCWRGGGRGGGGRGPGGGRGRGAGGVGGGGCRGGPGGRLGGGAGGSRRCGLGPGRASAPRDRAAHSVAAAALARSAGPSTIPLKHDRQVHAAGDGPDLVRGPQVRSFWCRAETLVLEAHARAGTVSPADAVDLVRAAPPPTPEAVAEVEAVTEHDVIAFPHRLGGHRHRGGLPPRTSTTG